MKEIFGSIEDAMQQSQVRYDLYEIIAMTIAAVIGNCDGWDEIEDEVRSVWEAKYPGCMNEDHSRIRKDHSPENLAVVRHFVISTLKQLPGPKRASIKRKRKICAYDLDLLASAVDLILL